MRKLCSLLFGVAFALGCFAGNPPSTSDAVVFTNDCIVYTMPSGTWSLADDYWLTNTWVRDGSGTLISDFPATSLITNFVQKGSGTLRVWWAVDTVGKSRVYANATWTVQQGVLSVQQSGATSLMNNRANLTIRLNEGTQLLFDSESAAGFYPGGHLTLQGASVVGGRGLQMAAQAFTNSTTKAKNTTFADPLPSVLGLFMNGTVTALPSALESVIDAPYLLVGSANFFYPAVFDVQEGATLRIRSSLADDLASHDGSSTNRVRSGFVKTGKGTLILTQPSALSGTVVVQDGTVVLEKYADFGSAQLIVADNAKIVLADGAALKTYGAVSQWPAVLLDAAIHVDAMTYADRTGTTVNPLRNFGTAGGAFTRTTGSTYAAVQADAFGTGRPGLSLGGGSAYRLTGFTNTVPQITVFSVMKRTAKDAWGGPFSFSSLTATNGDNGAVRAWYLENSATNASGNIAYMDVQYNKNQLVQLNNAFAWDAPVMAMAYTWGGGANSTNVFMQRTLAQTAANTNTSSVAFTVNHDMLYLWSRSSSYGNSMNAFSGIFGEVIIFFQSLTPAEVAGIQDYLMNKWFGAPLAAAQAPLTVTVNTNETASLAIPPVATVKKAGAGTLSLASAGAAATNLLSLDEGTLRFAESVIHRKAEIWVDPSDASSLTTNGSGRVTAALNKGRCGGTWVPNTTGPTLGTTYTSLRTAFEFQGAQALKLQTFRNTAGESNQALTVFAVLTRSPDLGAWNGAFVFAPSLALLTGDEDTIRQRLLYESASSTQDYVCGGGGLNQSITLPGDPTTPYLVALEEAPKSFLLSAEWAEGYGSPTNALFGFTKARENRCLEFVQLGARITTGYTPRGFWKGAVGEFLAFNCELTPAEKKAVMDYLRIRWQGTGSASPNDAPEVIAGVQPNETPGASLTLAAGTKVEQTAETQPVKDLAVGEGVTFERSGETRAAAFALFDVSGTLAMPSSVSLSLLALPDNNARLFTYGTASGTPTWTISGDRTETCTVVNNSADKAIWLIRDNGTLLMVR